MKRQILTISLLIATVGSQAQEVISSTGQTQAAAGLIVSQTVGEVVIGTYTNGITVKQGFHDNQLIITAIDEALAGIMALVYPNPFADHIRVTSSTLFGSVEVFDASGARVSGSSMTKGQLDVFIDMSTLSNGNYLLKVNHAITTGSNTYRIVKQ